VFLTVFEDKSEGDFRFAEARVRTYVESIAFYDGEKEEEQNATKVFATQELSVLTKLQRLFIKCWAIVSNSSRSNFSFLVSCNL
jgi:ABC-type uncharacterized transport system fused permease/ATPase subunit